MRKIHEIHKISGLSAGVFLFVLAFTGFFLNHGNWNFLNNITIQNAPKSAIDLQRKSWQTYLINNIDKNHILAGGKRGLYESFDNGNSFVKTLNKSIFVLRDYKDKIFVATNDGVYVKQKSKNSKWNLFLFKDLFINSMNINHDNMVLTIDKRKVVLVDLKINKTKIYENIAIEKNLLKEDITLSRLVRDLHYARGIFDGDLSLYINDYGAIILVMSSLCGFLMWYYISKIKIKTNRVYKNNIKYLVKIHSNIFIIIAIIPIFILAITGIFLDHSNDLRKFLKSNIIPNSILPPAYHSLESDIWGVDYDNGNFYIGNRYGVYKSKNLKTFTFISKGFAYRLIRQNNTLYISGMGSKNRTLEDNNIKITKHTPHMFKDIVQINNKYEYFSTSRKNLNNYKIPKFDNATLYDVLLSLHNGTFFASWWIWINDLISILFIILAISGFIRWKKRSWKKSKFNR